MQSRTLMERVEVIGREREKKEIIDKLMLPQTKTSEWSEDVPVPLVAIVGIAGIGKTKLADLVCEDEELRNRFGYPIKVDISIHDDIFQKESIAKEIKESASRAGKHRIILVLQDLRADITDQTLITNLLNNLISGSFSVSVGAILITTRNRGFIPKATRVLHLQGLNEEQSLVLFQRHVSDYYAEYVKQDSRISNIVGKCRGVPLAIITMAELLNSLNSLPLGAELFKKQLLQKLKPIYYDNLSQLHKQFFAYVSLLPKNYSINAQRLSLLWVAEGIIKTNLDPDEMGLKYLNDFVDMCIFQDLKHDEVGALRSCKMHPLLFDLACFVANGEKISISKDPCYVYEESQVLRASIDFSLSFGSQIPNWLFKKSKELSTILLRSKPEWPLPQDQVKMRELTCDKIFNTFKDLNVLDLHNLGIKKVPSSIGKLIKLKYLDFSHNNMEKLPSSITKLKELQTLILSQCHFLKELPKDLKNLSKLKHLDIEGCISLTHMPPEIEKLTSLQTLSHFVVSKNNHMGGLDELVELNNLKGNLEILHLERLRFHRELDYLKHKQHLQRLSLRWDQNGEEESLLDHQKPLKILEPNPNLKVLHILGYKSKDLSNNWLSTLQSLVKFSLYDCSEVQSLPPLDQLPSLKILELRSLHRLMFISETPPEVHLFFPSLKELTIWDCPKLESWWKQTNENFKRPIFSSISTLRVEHCPKLECMPLFPGLDEMLVLVNSSVKPIRDTIHYNEEARESFIIPFSKLKTMIIAGIEQSPPEEWIEKFTSLEKIHVRECPNLGSLPKGFKHLKSLQFLIIENCPMLDLDSSSKEWEGLKHLQTLIIREIPKLKTLPNGLEKVTSLEELKILDCHGLSSLPESIGNLTSLAKLVIYKCNKLDSLPKGLEKIKSLHTLTIMDCPLLLPRCQKETGDDWPQIAHIKNIRVNQTREDLGLQNSRLLL